MWIAREVPSSGTLTVKSLKTSRRKRLELAVGFVDLVDEQHGSGRRRDRAQQRPRQDEAIGEEDVVLTGDALDRLGQRRGAGPALR
jgi:hypothetical protein